MNLRRLFPSRFSFAVALGAVIAASSVGCSAADPEDSGSAASAVSPAAPGAPSIVDFTGHWVKADRSPSLPLRHFYYSASFDRQFCTFVDSDANETRHDCKVASGRPGAPFQVRFAVSTATVSEIVCEVQGGIPPATSLTLANCTNDVAHDFQGTYRIANMQDLIVGRESFVAVDGRGATKMYRVVAQGGRVSMPGSSLTTAQCNGAPYCIKIQDQCLLPVTFTANAPTRAGNWVNRIGWDDPARPGEPPGSEVGEEITGTMSWNGRTHRFNAHLKGYGHDLSSLIQFDDGSQPGCTN